jgi:hypothetical protein
VSPFTNCVAVAILSRCLFKRGYAAACQVRARTGKSDAVAVVPCRCGFAPEHVPAMTATCIIVTTVMIYTPSRPRCLSDCLNHTISYPLPDHWDVTVGCSAAVVVVPTPLSCHPRTHARIHASISSQRFMHCCFSLSRFIIVMTHAL